MQFIMQLLTYKGSIPGIMLLLFCDTLELYGSKIYMLWNDCCNRDIKEVDKVLRNCQMGNLSKEAIHKNLNQGRGTPFEDLKTIEELFPETEVTP